MNWQKYQIEFFKTGESVRKLFIEDIIKDVGYLILFFVDSMRWFFRRPSRFGEMIHQMEFVGNKSIFIICLTALFTGLVFAFQCWVGLSIVNAENLIGPTVGLGITRELGPVLTGLIIAARAGGAMAARLGTMRVTEQIDALHVIGVSPKQYLIAPRIIAAILSTPILTAVFNFVAMIGAYILAIKILQLDEAVFWDKTRFWLDPKDINEGLFKAAVFGGLFSTICTFQGYHTRGGAKGVGDATNKGVVSSMVSIIVIDFFITKLFRIFFKGGFV